MYNVEATARWHTKSKVHVPSSSSHWRSIVIHIDEGWTGEKCRPAIDGSSRRLLMSGLLTHHPGDRIIELTSPTAAMSD